MSRFMYFSLFHWVWKGRLEVLEIVAQGKPEELMYQARGIEWMRGVSAAFHTLLAMPT